MTPNHEQERKTLSKLAGIEYHSPLKRQYLEAKEWLDQEIFNAIHLTVGYTLWGMMVIAPKRYKDELFAAFEAWCFCHKRK
jgi:hypothetical protein